MILKNIVRQPSWTLENQVVQAAVTQTGGHLGPVTFRLGRRLVRPFHIAPWAEEKIRALPPVLQAMRGDFFCLPFGANATPWRKERHPAHGQTANDHWQFVAKAEAAETQSLHLRMKTTIRPAQVDKLIQLRTGHPAIYCRHTISGATGPMSLGHHAMLQFPTGESGRISTSPIAGGQVYPGRFENPVEGGYSCLKAGAAFRSLKRVPLAEGGQADLTSYPAREGFEDLVMVSAKPESDFAWSAAVFSRAGYVWFALKDPRVLASTVMWHSHGGRHYPPWNGRHRRVLALEEVTSHFHDGLAESAATNSLTDRGIPTTVKLSSKRPTTVNLIMAVAEVPKGFETVHRIEPHKNAVVLRGANRLKISVPINWDFLYAR